MKNTLCIFAVAILVSTSAFAKKEKIPEPFQGGNNRSSLSIQYHDLSTVLRSTVIAAGMSTRKRVGKSYAPTGSRVSTKVNSLTANESNRFYFKAFKNKDNLAILTKIRKDLESVPTGAPLKYFSDKEQIAYWLNLYNVTLLEQLATYPSKKLRKELFGKKSILDKKLLTVSGVPLSLNDIQFKILIPKFGRNPLIMYGLFQGVIGGPNIRKEAYTGKELFKQLRSNAKDFINSNRGMMSKGKGKIQVSWLYKRNAALYPNFNADIKRHMLKYLEGEYFIKVNAAKKFTPKTMDYSRADLSGGNAEIRTTSNTNGAAMLSATKGTAVDDSGNVMVSARSSYLSTKYMDAVKLRSRFAPHVEALLNEIRRKNKNKKGEVTIEEQEKKEEKK